jgi:hypothetical protein
MDEQKQIEILLKFGIVDADKAKAASKALQNIERDAAAAKKRLNETRESIERLQQVGVRLAATGAAMLAPFLLSANKYVQSAQKSESTSSRWLDSTSRLEQAQIRLGRATTSILNPAMEKTADIAERIVSAVERNPQMLQGVLALGSGLVGIGTLVSVTASIGKTIATLETLSMSGGVAGMAGKAGMALGQVTLLASSVIIGAEAGALIGNAIASKLYGPGYKQQSISDVIVTLVKLYSLPLVGINRLLNELFKKLGLDNSLFNKTAETINTVLNQFQKFMDGMPLIGHGEVPPPTPKESGKTIDWSSFAKQGQSMLESIGQQILKLEQNNETQRAQALANFAMQERNAEQNYYLQREQAAANHSLQMLQMEQQHQLEMRRMSRDHNERMDDLVAARDALGMVKEKRRYEEQRSDAEEAYRQQVAQQNAAFALQLKQMEQNYQLQRKQALEQFQLQQREREKQYDQQLKALLEEQKKELNVINSGIAAKLAAESMYASSLMQIGVQMRAEAAKNFAASGIGQRAKSIGRLTQGNLQGGIKSSTSGNANINMIVEGDGLSVKNVNNIVKQNTKNIIKGLEQSLRMAGI